MNLNQSVVILLSLAFVQVKGQQSVTTTCGQRFPEHKQRLPRMVNAFEAKRWPWHAAVYHRNEQSVPSYQCGGTVISSNLILTAGHCVSRYSAPMQTTKVIVLLGRLNLEVNESSSQSFEVAKIILHPNYNAIDLDNDIAIIQLSKNASFNNYVQPVCMWNPDKIEISKLHGKYGTVVGWGRTEWSEMSNVLREASMPVVSPLECLLTSRCFVGPILSETNFCAGSRNGTWCFGDDGGSMTFEENGRYFIRGIMSVVPYMLDKEDYPVCDPMKYSIFTDVAQYLTWIDLYLPIECQTNVRCSFKVFGNGLECEILLRIRHYDRKCEIFFTDSLNTDVTGLYINGQLDAFPDLSGAINKFESLTSLNLTSTNLKIVEKSKLAAFRRIQILSLSKNVICKLDSDTFDDLKDLSYLGISHNKLQEIHQDQFNELCNLTMVYLNKNQLKVLPVKLFRNNQNLQKLWLQENEIDFLHRDIFNGLRNLTTLYVDYNELQHLPEGVFRDLHNLTVLHLDNNQLDILPDDLFRNNQKLEEIWLQDNTINVLHPDVFMDLHNLEKLNLHNNQLVELPEGVFNDLLNLKELNLYKNLLPLLPDGLFRYNRKLETITLYENRIQILRRDVLAEQLNLTTIYLHKNQLDILPDGLFRNNRKLKEVWLQDNTINILHPDVFNDLHDLEKLNLYNNRLKILPGGVFKDLHSLTSLHLSNNKLKSLPDDLFLNNQNLEEIWLRDNKIAVLNQDLFKELHKLVTLRLDNNQLENLPEKVFMDLLNLRELNLKTNQLEILPDGLFRSNTKLKEIWLQENKIQVIECDFHDLSNLVHVDLSRNICMVEDCELKSTCGKISFCGEKSLRQMHRKIWNKCPSE